MAENKPNPYGFGDDIDDDLFNDPQAHRDGTHPDFADPTSESATRQLLEASQKEPCPSCGRVHGIPGMESLPSQLQGLVMTFLRAFSEGEHAVMGGASSPRVLATMAGIISFSGDVNDSAVDAPLLLALADTVDELTEGKVTKKLALYSAERRLICAHMVLRSVNNFSERMHADVAVNQYFAEESYQETIAHLLSYYTIKLERAKTEYNEACIALAWDPDPELLDNGHYDKTREQGAFRESFLADSLRRNN